MNLHRALGHVDRSAMTEDSPLHVVLATEGRKADGIDLRMSGARLERFRANPVLGYGHSYRGRADLPIGRVVADSLRIDGPTVHGDLEFDSGDPFAREIERKMRDGFINAVSIGFSVQRWADPKSNYWTGGVAEEWELSELSVVPIGMDPKALVSGRGFDGDELRMFLDLLRQALHDNPGVLPGEAKPPTEDPAPAVPAIDSDAARAFVAAFKL